MEVGLNKLVEKSTANLLLNLRMQNQKNNIK